MSTSLCYSSQTYPLLNSILEVTHRHTTNSQLPSLISSNKSDCPNETSSIHRRQVTSGNRLSAASLPCQFLSTCHCGWSHLSPLYTLSPFPSAHHIINCRDRLDGSMARCKVQTSCLMHFCTFVLSPAATNTMPLTLEVYHTANFIKILQSKATQHDCPHADASCTLHCGTNTREIRLHGGQAHAFSTLPDLWLTIFGRGQAAVMLD